MTVRATVLYDAPGPKARQFNRIVTIATFVIAIAVIAWVLKVLGDNGQLAVEKWTPFLKSTTWTTYILPGLWGTLKAALVSIILAIIIGALLGVGRLSKNKAIRWFCGIIVEFFRAIPVLILMIFAYSVFATYAIVPSAQLGFAGVVFGLTMYNGSVIAETLRAGILSLPTGQREAAEALGLSHRQTIWNILLPQAVATMLPALISQLVIALKDTALGYMILYVEVVRSGLMSASYYRNYLPALVVVAIIMIAINFGLSRLAERIERQLRAGRARKNILAHVPEVEDQGIETKDTDRLDWRDPYHQDLRLKSE